VHFEIMNTRNFSRSVRSVPSFLDRLSPEDGSWSEKILFSVVSNFLAGSPKSPHHYRMRHVCLVVFTDSYYCDLK